MRSTTVGMMIILVFAACALPSSIRFIGQPSEPTALPSPANFLSDETPNPDLVTTVQPDPHDYPFEIVNNAVFYGYTPTLSCQFVIAGDVEFLDDDPLQANVQVKFERVDMYDEAFRFGTAGIGYGPEYGPNGWSQMIIDFRSYFFWLEDRRTGDPLSPRAFVTELNCENGDTLALINFRQVRPLVNS